MKDWYGASSTLDLRAVRCFLGALVLNNMFKIR